MSGNADTPPTYYFSGITFNPSFFTSSSSDYLTKQTAKSYFLSYPTAQGTETISTLKASSIDSSTTTTAFDFLPSQTANINIGNTSSGTSGQIIKIGPTATTAITVGDLSVIANSLNNSTNSANRSVKIGDLQTDGGADLDLGAHISRLGDINIGTGNLFSTPTINIGATLLNGSVRAGATINIGRMTTNPINVGNANANVTINSSSGSIKTPALATGTLTASSLITANGGVSVPAGQTLNVIGNQTSTGLITANGGITCAGLTTNSGITVSGTPSSINASGGSLTIGGATTTLIINSSTGQLWGATTFNIATTNFTIPSTINRDYYLFCNANVTAYSIILPTRLTNQIIHLRNFSGQTLNVTAPTTTPTTAIYPTGFTTPFTTTWTGFLNNTVQTFYCDGTNWLGF
jgi:hypothetical protein